MFLTPEQIMDVDRVKNPVGLSQKDYEIALKNAHNLKQFGDSLLWYEMIAPAICEFHFANAARIDDFVENVKAAFAWLKEQGIKSAITWYENEAVTHVAKRSELNVEIKEVNIGPGEKYELIVRL